MLTRKHKSLIRSLYTRHGRKKSGCCVCEGLRAVRELCERRSELVDFVVISDQFNEEITTAAPVYCLPEREFAELAGTVNSQGILAVARVPAEPGREAEIGQPFILALDALGDPGNFGTICRTVKAAGLSELWYTRHSIDPFGDKAVRSALGAQFSLNLRCFADLAEMRQFGLIKGFDKVFLTDPHGGESCFTAPDLFEKSIVVIGGEANGVGFLAESRKVMIPMPGKFESLNAAQAATIFLFEYVRRIS